MPPVVEFTAERCVGCSTFWDKCTPEQRGNWTIFTSSVTGRDCCDYHNCAPPNSLLVPSLWLTPLLFQRQCHCMHLRISPRGWVQSILDHLCLHLHNKEGDLLTVTPLNKVVPDHDHLHNHHVAGVQSRGYLRGPLGVLIPSEVVTCLPSQGEGLTTIPRLIRLTGMEVQDTIATDAATRHRLLPSVCERDHNVRREPPPAHT